MTTVVVPQQAIPGPRALPLLSWRANMLKLYQNPFKYLRWLHNTYGDLVTLGNASYICAFGPALNFQILSDPHLFEVGGGTPLARFRKDTAFGKLMTLNLTQMNGEKHKQHRHLMQPAFHKQQIARYGEDMLTLTQQTLDSWQGQSQIDLHRAMQRLTQRIAVKTLFGLYDEVELTRVDMLLHDMTSSMLLVMVLPLDIPGTPYHRVLRISEQLDALIRALIEEKREQKDATDALAALIQAHDEDGTRLNDDELIGHAFTLFVAGHETTSNASIRIPAVQRRTPYVHRGKLCYAGDESGSGDGAPALPPFGCAQCQDLLTDLNATHPWHANACLPSRSAVPACASTRDYS